MLNANVFVRGKICNTSSPFFSIDPNLRPVVYCHGVETGSKDEWEFAFRKYQEVNTGAEKSTLLRALGCTKQAWLLRRLVISSDG